MLLDLPGPALRLLTDVADFHFSDIAVRGDDGARAIGANERCGRCGATGSTPSAACSLSDISGSPVVGRSFVLWTKGSRRNVRGGGLRGGTAILFSMMARVGGKRLVFLG